MFTRLSSHRARPLLNIHTQHSLTPSLPPVVLHYVLLLQVPPTDGKTRMFYEIVVAPGYTPALAPVVPDNIFCYRSPTDGETRMFHEIVVAPGHTPPPYPHMPTPHAFLLHFFLLLTLRSPTDGETRMFYEIVVAPGYTPPGFHTRRFLTPSLLYIIATGHPPMERRACSTRSSLHRATPPRVWRCSRASEYGYAHM
jgi:hypothetical protein